MILVKDLYKKLMGSDGANKEALEAKEREAEHIKKKMHKDIDEIRERVDHINLTTYNKLKQVSKDLRTVTYHIAVASGGRSRGLK